MIYQNEGFIKGNKYITMFNNSVHIVIAKTHWEALEKGRIWFGDNRVRAWRDTLSSQLSSCNSFK